MNNEASVVIHAGDEMSSLMEVSMMAKTNSQIEKVEEAMLGLPQIEQELTHTFSPGIYMRQLFIPKGAFIIGHLHKTEHLNLLLKGRMTVVVDGRLVEVSAPFVVNSLPGTRKMGYAHEDSIWANIHATEETDLDKLEENLVQKSDTFKSFETQVLAELKEKAEEPLIIEI